MTNGSGIDGKSWGRAIRLYEIGLVVMETVTGGDVRDGAFHPEMALA